MIRLKSVEAILLDAAGTLFDVRPSVGAIYSMIARGHGIDIDAAVAQREFSRAFHERSASGLPAGTGSDPGSAERSWWLDIVRGVFAGRMSERVLEEYFAEVFEAFRRGDSYEVFPDAETSLAELKSSGFRLGVLSNYDSRLFDVLDQLDLARHFEVVVISWQAGAAKPDSRIFLHAARKLDIPAQRIVHVGNSLTDDYEGARRAGLGAVLLDRKGIYRGRDELTRVESLAELHNLLEPIRPD